MPKIILACVGEHDSLVTGEIYKIHFHLRFISKRLSCSLLVLESRDYPRPDKTIPEAIISSNVTYTAYSKCKTIDSWLLPLLDHIALPLTCSSQHSLCTGRGTPKGQRLISWKDWRRARNWRVHYGEFSVEPARERVKYENLYIACYLLGFE